MSNATGDAKPGSADSQTGQESLAEYLARAGRLPILQGFALAVQLLADLDASHRGGLDPGEISIPALRISRTGRLLVPSTGRTAQDGLRPPRYGEVAPDLLAAAAVAYELLTGMPPFAGTDDAATRAAGPGQRPTPVRARRPELPLALDAVFERAFAARPESRYRSAAEFSEALQAAMPEPRWDRSLPAATARTELQARPPASDGGRARVPPARAERPVTAATRRRPGPALASGAAITVLAVALWTGLDAPSLSGQHDIRTAASSEGIQDFRAAGRTELVEHAPVTSSIEPNHIGAAPEEPDAASPPAPAMPAAPLERRHAAPVDRKAATPPPGAHAREGRPDARRASGSHRPTRLQVLQVAHALRPGPDAACRQDFAIAPQACTAFRCATSEFRQHPVCVRMHAEAARVRAQLAESRGGP